MRRSHTLLAALTCLGLEASAFDARRNMKVTSALLTSISGKLGGAVGMTSRFGMQLRELITPNNPDTGPQFVVRNIIKSLGVYWLSTMTDVQRATWTNLAEDTPGSSDGKGLFVKANTLRLRMDDPAITIKLTAPDSPGAVFNDTPSAISVTVAAGVAATLEFNLPFGVAGAGYSDSWAVLDGGCIAFSVSRPQRATRTTKIKPFVQIGHLLGKTTAASRPAATQAIGLWDAGSPLFDQAFASLDVGDVVYVEFQATDSAGRITAKFTQRVVATA